MKDSKRSKGGGGSRYWWKFPRDITFNILSRLPVETLIRCRYMLKEWRTIIADPHFINAHHIRASQAEYPDVAVLYGKKLYIVNRVGSIDESVRHIPLHKYLADPIIVNSCNGLLCLISKWEKFKFHGTMRVWNPATKEIVQLPSCAHTLFRHIQGCGFGYDPICDQYKAVVFFISPSIQIEAEVYTLGSSSWRRVGEVPLFVPRQSNVLLNGTLHWLAICEYQPSLPGIGCFDIKDEKFRFVPLASQIVPNTLVDFDLGVLGGCLSIIDYSKPEDAVIWVLKNCGGVKAWAKQFVLSFPAENLYPLHLLHRLKHGELLLEYDSKMLASFEPKRRQFRDVINDTRSLYGSLRRRAFVHVESLVSPRIGSGGH